MVNVGVNGYGIIGKRVAEAVSKQDDMKLVGIAKREPDYKAKLAVKRGFKIYASGDQKSFDGSGVEIAGRLEDLVKSVDIIVDCTPEGVAVKNKALYEKAGIKAIWQGGEDHELTNLSFNAYANYNSAMNARYLRVVSCNTTALLRTLVPLHKQFGVKSANAFLVRRAADPSETKKGPINALEPDKHLPSHHGEDVKSVMPELNIETAAAKASTTLMHLHYVDVVLGKNATEEEVLETFGRYRRIALFSLEDGVTSTAQVMDYARDLGRDNGDLYEIAVWKEFRLNGNRLRYFQAVHQESDVIPENVDAIRAMCNIESDPQKSIDKTDKTLHIGV